MSILQNYKSSFLLLLSMIAGGTFGIYLGHPVALLDSIANLFLNLLYCIVVPMIFISLVTAIARMTDLKKIS